MDTEPKQTPVSEQEAPKKIGLKTRIGLGFASIAAAVGIFHGVSGDHESKSEPAQVAHVEHSTQVELQPGESITEAAERAVASENLNENQETELAASAIAADNRYEGTARVVAQPGETVTVEEGQFDADAEKDYRVSVGDNDQNQQG